MPSPIVDELKRKAGVLGDAFRQQGAGVFETFASSPEAQGVEKAIPSFIFGLAGLVNTGINLGVRSVGGPENVLPAESLLGKHAATVQQANEIFGVEDPKDFVETLNRISLAALIPSPKVPGSNLLAKAATEIIAPGLQTRSVIGASGAVAIPFVASEGLAELTDLEDYQSVFDVMRNEKGATLVDADDDPLGLGAAIDDKDPLGLDTVIGGNGPDATLDLVNANSRSDPLGVRIDGDDPLGLQQVIEQEEDRSATALIAGAAIAALAVLGARARMRARSARSVTPPNLTGERARTSVTKKTTKLKTAFINKNQAITDAVEQAVSPADAKQFADDLQTTVTPQAMSSRVQDTFVTGQLPNSSLRVPRPALHLDTLGKMTEQQRNMYDSALLAGTKMDDLNASGKNVWGNVSVGQLKAQMAQVNIDPQVAFMVDEARELYRGFRDYMHEAGVISGATKADWERTSPNFVPTRINFTDGDDFLDRRLNMFRETEQHELGKGFKSLLGRSEDVLPGEALPPSRLMESYIAQAIRYTEQNRIRRQFFDNIQNSRQLGSSIKKANGPGTNVVPVLRNGTTEYWRVDGDYIRTALKFQPATVAPILNATRRMVQELSTGTLRPDFIPVSWSYEIPSAVLLKQKGRGIGVIDELLSKAGAGPLPIPDPTAAISPFTGALRAGYAEMMKSIFTNLELSIRTNGTLSQILGPQESSRLAKVTFNAYENSTQRLFERFGGGNAPFLASQEIEAVDAMMTRLAPRFTRAVATSGWDQAKANGITRAYVNFVHAMHNSIRLQHVASNRALTKSDRALNRLMADTRKLTGDVSQIGGNKAVQGISSSILYGNTFTQIFAQHMRTIKADPVAYWGTTAAFALGGAGLLMSQTKDNPKAREHYWNTLTASQRASHLPIYDTEGRVIMRMPIYHEMRPIWAPFIESVGTMFGYKNGDPLDFDQALLQRSAEDVLGTFDQRAVEDVRFGLTSAVGSVLPDPVPPVFGAIAGAFNVDPNISVGRHNLTRPSTERITPHRNSRVANSVFNTQTEIILSELLGSTSRPFIDSVDAFARTYDNGGNLQQSADAAIARFNEPIKERSPFGPVLWDAERTVSANDANQRLVGKKRDKIREISKQFGLETLNPGGAGRSVQTGRLQSFVPEGIPEGSPLSFILSATANVDSFLSRAFGQEIARLRREQDAIRANPQLAGDPATMKARLNSITHEIRVVNEQALEFIMEQEDFISESLGQDFRFENFDPGDFQ